MQLTFLGTGSAIPNGDRAQSGYVLEGPDRTILVECGAGVLHRLARAGYSIGELDAVLISHHHLDHLADLLPLLKARWLTEAGPLSVYGPAGTEALIAELLEVHEYLAGRVDYAVTELEPPRGTVAGRTVELHDTEHSMPGLAIRLPGPAGDLTMSGDTDATAEIASFADGSAVLVHDCSFPDDADAGNHATPSRLGRVLADVTVGRVVLTHLYPVADERAAELCETVGKHVDAPVDVLPDLTTILVR